MKLCKRIKSFDQYGHHVNLNFNKKGPIHQNSIGGILSIAMTTFTLFLIIKRLQIMYNHEQDSIIVTPMSVQLNDVGEVNLRDMNMLFYY
jgi:hypothetical protein